MANSAVILSKDSFEVSLNKLKMYYEEEEKTFKKIIANFENLTSGYVSSSTTIRTEYYLKIKNNLNMMIDNRQKQLLILNKVVSRYNTIAKNSVKQFNTEN